MNSCASLHQVTPLLSLPPQALTAGVFELKVDSFTSSSGICGQKSEDCLIFFRVCLKHSQNVIKPEPPCTYGEALTDVFDADSNSISEREPIRVPFLFKWPVSDDSHACFRRDSSAANALKEVFLYCS